jgi:dienelactone hydrolase
MYMRLLPILLIATIAAICSAEEPNAAVKAALEPGKEALLKFDTQAIKCECIVYVPIDYNDNYNWPVLFFYHGKGAPLSTERIKIATQGKNFVIVCMEFAPTTAETMSQGQYHYYLQQEIKNLAFVRHWLQEKLKIDPKMTVLAGFSRGGWLAADILNFRPLIAAAMMDIGAGYQEWLMKDAPSLAGKYVYIGAGETDENLLAAKKAIKYFANQGAEVTYEVYAGVGHKFKADSPKLQNWLCELRDKLNHPAAETKPSDTIKQ